jgi:hypothetical protein
VNEVLKGYPILSRIPPVEHFTESEKKFLIGCDLLYFYAWKGGVITNEGFISIGNPVEVYTESYCIGMKFRPTFPIQRLDAYGMWVEDGDGIVRSVKHFIQQLQMDSGDTLKLKYILEFDIIK